MSVKVIAAELSPRVVSSTQTRPGSAALWTRAAVFTASPATMPSAVAPTVTATSPVTTPTRSARPWRSDLLAHRRNGRDQLEAGADRALGVVLVRDGDTPHRHHRVADELLDDTAVAPDHHPALREVRREQLAHLLGVPALRERGEADQVAEQHRGDPALGDRPLGDRRSGRRRALVQRLPAVAAEPPALGRRAAGRGRRAAAPVSRTPGRTWRRRAAARRTPRRCSRHLPRGASQAPPPGARSAPATTVLSRSRRPSPFAVFR